MLPDMFYLFIVITVIVCMYSMLVHLLYGYRLEAVASYSEAIYTSFKYVILGDDR